jgi:hypothetical protein
MNPFCKVQFSFVVSLFLLAGGVLSLRFHYDFFAGFGICAGVAVVAISTLKRHRASFAQKKS